MGSALSEGMHRTKGDLRKSSGRPTPSTTERKKRLAAEISPQEDNVPKKPKFHSKRKEIFGRWSGLKVEARRHAANYANAVKDIRLVILPKLFPEHASQK